MTRLTPVFLVLLRLAIGWHFLFEGLDKINNPTWSSAGYLREASGPLAGQFNDLAGDPVVLYCEVPRLPGATDSAQVPPNQQLPPALAKEWDNWFERFVKYYDLKDNELAAVQRVYDQRKSQTGSWLHGEGDSAKKVITKSAFGVSAEVQQTVPERVAEYKKAVQRLNELQTKERASFVAGANAYLPAEKAKVAKGRADLLADVDEQTMEMKKLVREQLPVAERAQRLTEELKEQRFAKEPPEKQAESATEVKQAIVDAIEKTRKRREELEQKKGEVNDNKELTGTEKQVETARLDAEIKGIPAKMAELAEFLADFREEENPAVRGGLALAPVANEPYLKSFLPEPTTPGWRDTSWLKWDRRQWSDFLVRYGLTAVGLCLLLGLFTRTSCVVGAVFLTMFYLAMMPLPWLPENPKAEGHYVYINKNIIEMLALLALATTVSGRWVGLDGLVHYFSPFRRSKGPKKAPKKSRGTEKLTTPAPTTNGTETHEHTEPVVEHTEPAEVATTLKPTHPEG